MTIDRDFLYQLLPVVYRQRDEEHDEELGGPLRQLLEVLTDELAVVADGVDQLYDDLFVETAAPWALPYLAELIGLRGLPSGSGSGLTPRAEVANTISYRRRKGTAAVLEQVARDVTRWPSRAVEFFELIAAAQHMNHVRPGNLVFAPIRDATRMGYVGSPFERLSGRPDLTHTVDVRRIRSRRGRYNIPNVGIFNWRLKAYPLTASPAVPADPADATRFHIHPLGVASGLYTLPVTEDEITHLAEPLNVPHALGRRELHDAIGSFYGPGLSIDIAGVAIPGLDVCNLSDLVDGAGNVTGWAHTPRAAGRVAIDPVLGRLAFGDDQASPPLVSHHVGFSADLGGGEYNRAGTFAGFDVPVRVSQQDPAAVQTIDDGLAQLGNDSGTVEIGDSGRYGPVADLTVDSRSLEIRAADRCRPVLDMDGDELVIDGDGEGQVTLNGLLVTGGAIRVRNLRSLRLTHCTLVPGISLDAAGLPAQPGVPSVVVESATTTVTIERCILGPLRAHVDAVVAMSDSICDAGQEGVAYASEAGDDLGGGRLTVDASTVFGKIHTRVIELVSNSILLGVVSASDDPTAWPGPVLADRRQEGCVRFSYVPPGSRTPQRYRCQPVTEVDSARVRPVFTSERYLDPGYGQLNRRTPDEIWRGADDESEMGALHHLYQPQRAAYLEARLDDYLRFGLEAGFFFAS
jgi:hypothetical protein